MKKILMIIGGLVVVGAVLVAAFVFFFSRAPYSIPVDKISFDYVQDLQTVGTFEQSYVDTDLEYVIFSDPNNEDSSGILVRPTENINVLNEVIGVYEDEECDVRVRTNGESNGVSYYQGRCDDSAYYAYVDATGDSTVGILFETIDLGQDGLNLFIESFIQ